MANLEASKTVLEMTSPLAGKIIKRNEAVVSQPDLLNSTDPADNWLVQLTDVDVASYAALACLLYTSPSPRDKRQSRMPSSA